jgi:DnaJ-class molecular chaperone
MTVEDWVAQNGLVLNKTIAVRVICPQCGGEGEIPAKSYPNQYPVKVACPTCNGLGHITAKVFLKKVSVLGGKQDGGV